MLMLPRKRQFTAATVAMQIAMISTPALGIPTSISLPHLKERLAASVSEHGRKTTCKRNATCSDSDLMPMFVSSEKDGGSPTPSNKKLASGDQHAQESVSELLRALRSDEALKRSRAAKALGRLGKAAEPAMPALLMAAEDDRWNVRADAVWAIGKVVHQDQALDAVSVLTNALEDPSDRVRWSAAWSLARIGPAAEAAIPALIERLKDPTRNIRASAVSALTRVASQSSHEAVIPALARLKDDDDDVVRQRAAKALQALKSLSNESSKP